MVLFVSTIVIIISLNNILYLSNYVNKSPLVAGYIKWGWLVLIFYWVDCFFTLISVCFFTKANAFTMLHAVFEPLDFIAKLAAIPKSRAPPQKDLFH